MGRQKAFDPHEALDGATRTFRRHGYAGASIDRLTRAMGIRRASAYATFGDKRTLFLRCLEAYALGTSGGIAERLAGAEDPLAGVREVLLDVAQRAAEPDGRDGCLLTNTAAELSGLDREIAAVVRGALTDIEDAYHRALERAREAGSLDPARDPRAIARFLVTTMHGLRIMGEAGADARALRAVAEEALRSLGPGAEEDAR
jgi:TetR/AcrR family transcriptional regulator, transcriptional repressor for nem operon